MNHNNLIITFFLLIFGLISTGCNQQEEASPAPAHIRVFDIRYSGEEQTFSPDMYYSAFEWDGHYYNHPALDTIQAGKMEVPNFGNFLMGRVYYEDNRGLFLEYPHNITFGANPTFPSIDYIGLNNLSANGVGNDTILLAYQQGFERSSKLYFPNLSHRTIPAPIRNGIDYYKWGAFPSGSHHIAFPIFNITQKPSRLNTYPRSGIFAQQQQYFEPNGMYSIFLIKPEVHESKLGKIITIKENPNMVFEQDKVYVRFVNAIQTTQQAGNDVWTDALDIYMIQVDSGELKAKLASEIQFDFRYLPSATPEKLVATQLKRFEINQTDFPFIALDYSAFFAAEQQNNDLLTAQGTPSYIFYVYPHGASAQTGATPLTKYTFIMSNIKQLSSASNNQRLNFIPPIAKIQNGYIPTISTVFLGSGGIYYSFEQVKARQNYLDEQNK
jgi:hypothetical protein